MGGEATRPNLQDTTAHEVVRDFPETLRVFRAHGVALRRYGAEPVGQMPGASAGLAEALAAAVAWRSADPGKDGSGAATDDRAGGAGTGVRR